MPNRTIYVADADLPIFEKAQALAGENLSATIVQALRKFIETQESKMQGYQEITVKVGKGAYTYKRFNGRLVAKGHFNSSDDAEHELFEVYQTAKGKIALYVRRMPGQWFAEAPKHGKYGRRWERGAWRNWWEEAFNPENWAKWAEWRGDSGSWQAELEVYDKLEEMIDRVPLDLYEAAKNNLSGDSIETLDI